MEHTDLYFHAYISLDITVTSNFMDLQLVWHNFLVPIASLVPRLLQLLLTTSVEHSTEIVPILKESDEIFLVQI